MIQRYETWGLDQKSGKGDWVLYDDHAAELARLEAQVPKWISVDERLPDAETPVFIKMRDGTARIGELRWEYPSYEDNWKKFLYWDDPYDDGKPWEYPDILKWMPIPPEAA